MEGKSQSPVAHAYNPSYSEGIDQEDHSLEPAWANSLWGPYHKKTPSHTHKKAGGVAQGIGPEFKPQYHKQNKTKQQTNKKQNGGKNFKKKKEKGKSRKVTFLAFRLDLQH
jgi:hypothetical protein